MRTKPAAFRRATAVASLVAARHRPGPWSRRCDFAGDVEQILDGDGNAGEGRGRGARPAQGILPVGGGQRLLGRHMDEGPRALAGGIGDARQARLHQRARGGAPGRQIGGEAGEGGGGRGHGGIPRQGGEGRIRGRFGRVVQRGPWLRGRCRGPVRAGGGGGHFTPRKAKRTAPSPRVSGGGRVSTSRALRTDRNSGFPSGCSPSRT